MTLTGQAKRDYQREYMRNRRSNAKSVRPITKVRAELDPFVRPDPRLEKMYVDAAVAVGVQVKPQSYSPMMVGYIPPKGEKK